MTTIWKYKLTYKLGAPLEEQELEMPMGAAPLTVQMQEDALCLWAIVNPEAPKLNHKVYVFGTGGRLPDIDPTVTHRYRHGYIERGYIGSVQDGPYVWHVFWGMTFI